jgi:hypothetical protein
MDGPCPSTWASFLTTKNDKINAMKTLDPKTEHLDIEVKGSGFEDYANTEWDVLPSMDEGIEDEEMM